MNTSLINHSRLRSRQNPESEHESVTRNPSGLSFFLVTTDHLTDKIWFRDDDDFKAAMNYVAIISFVAGVKVLAFILMSNNVHFVLQCERNNAEAFISEFKRRYGMYINKKYGLRDFFRLNDVDIQELNLEEESLEKAIAYVLMNSVAANICLNASDYPWGSAGIYFKIGKPEGVTIESMSQRKRERILHSREPVPGWLIFGKDGYILPESYVPVKFVESVFRTPKRMNFFLLNSSKAKRRLSNKDAPIPSFKDQVILSAAHDLCSSLFQKNSPHNLDPSEMAELINQIRWRFSSDINQIARVLGIKYSEITRALENFCISEVQQRNFRAQQGNYSREL